MSDTIPHICLVSQRKIKERKLYMKNNDEHDQISIIFGIFR